MADHALLQHWLLAGVQCLGHNGTRASTQKAPDLRI
jgi:hypothetical protein